MSNRNKKTKEELRRYDIFKGTVAILIGILLLLSIVTGAVDPNDLTAGGTDADSTAATSPEESGTTEEEAAEIEINAPELAAPEAGSELQAGPVSFSGTGSAGSQVAVVAGGQELGRTPVDDNGEWEIIVELEPGIEEIELQAMDSDGNVAATSPAIPFTVSDGGEEIAFAANPLQNAAGGLILVTGSGRPGHLVAINLNGEQAAETEINEDGAWSIEVEPGQEAAEVSVSLISPDGENVETISAGQIEALAVAPEIDTPDVEMIAGEITLSGAGQPGATLILSAGGEELGTAVVQDDGTWNLDTSLPVGETEIEAAMLDEDGSSTEMIATVKLTLSAPEAPQVAASQLPLPDFSALTGALTWEGEADPGSRLALLVNDETIEETSTGTDGQWTLNYNLQPGPQEIAFGRLDEDGNVLSQTDPQAIEVPGEMPQVTLPAFSLPDDLLAFARQEQMPGETGAEATDAADEAADTEGEASDAGDAGTDVEGEGEELTDQDRLLAGIDLDSIELPHLLFPVGPIEWNGRTEPGSEVAYLVDGEIVDTATAAEDGSFTVSSDFTDEGEHTVQLGIPGEDGELIARSQELLISLADLDLPTIELPELTGDETSLTVSGTAGAGEAVEVTADGETVGETTADNSGRWSLDFALPDTADLRAQVLNEEGEPLLQSIPVVFPGLAAAGDDETGAEGEASISGSITHPEPVTLPDDAVVTVQIQDTSKQDVAAEVIGEQTIEAGGQQLPIPYEVAYDPADIDEQATYSMRVTIKDGDGNLLFTNDTAIPAITNGNPTENVEIPTVQVESAETAVEDQEEASVTGTITYQERIALPDDAVVTVQIQDISTPGSTAAVLGEQTIETNGQQVPIPFEVTYDPADIVENHTYSAAVRIEDSAGNLLFVNDTAIPVITNGNPTEDVEIETVKVDTSVSDVVLDESEDLIGEEGESVVDAAEESGSFSTLLDGLQAAGLTETLQDVGGEYTLFAPTNEAFQAIPPELAEAWEVHPQSYEDLLRHMVVEGNYTPDDLTDGQVLTSLAGKEILIERDGDVLYANGVPVVDYAEVGNSTVYATPQIILPLLALNENLPIIDESGVPTFVGPLLTVVGLGEPGMEILLTVDGENFGEIATIEPNGFWLVKGNVESGVRYLLAYMVDEEGILHGISQEVVLPVP